MKKRLLSLFMVGLMAASIVGCGKQQGAVNGNHKDASVTDVDTDSQPVTEVAPEQTVKDPEENRKDPIIDEDLGYEVLMDYSSDWIIAVNKYGDIIDKYSRDDIISVFASDEISYTDILTMKDGIVYVKAYISGTNEGMQIIAVDPKRDKWAVIADSFDGRSCGNTDLYDDAVYVTSYLYEDNLIYRSENKYTLDKDKFTFNKMESKANSVLDKVTEYNLFTNKEIADNYLFSDGYEKTLDKYGFIIGEKDSEYYKILPTGDAEKLEGIECDTYLNVEGYDDKHIFMSSYDFDTYSYVYHQYDFDTKTFVDVLSGDEHFMLYTDGLLYFSRNTSEEYGVSVNEVYAYNPDSYETTFIYTAKSCPGTEVDPGVSGFRKAGENIYFLTASEKGIIWDKLQYSEAIYYYDYVCNAKESSFAKYGHVEYITYSNSCPTCNDKVLEAYIERFVVDPNSDELKISKEVADIINADQQQRQLDLYNSEMDYVQFDLMDSCEFHGEWHSTFTNKITNVSMIEGKYLAVFTGGYDYNGGAHGYPSKYQMVYDINTGSRVFLSDIYEGTDEAFNQLLVEKTIADYNSYDEENSPYYYGMTEDSIRESLAYYSPSLCNVEFYDGYVEILLSPYELGPFSSGFIAISISYEELLGRSTLSKY